MEGRSDWGRYDFGTFQRRDVLTMGRFDCKAWNLAFSAFGLLKQESFRTVHSTR